MCTISNPSLSHWITLFVRRVVSKSWFAVRAVYYWVYDYTRFWLYIAQTFDIILVTTHYRQSDGGGWLRRLHCLRFWLIFLVKNSYVISRLFSSVMPRNFCFVSGSSKTNFKKLLFSIALFTKTRQNFLFQKERQLLKRVCLDMLSHIQQKTLS